MSETRTRLLTSRQARMFMDGPEVCREYVKTERMWFGTSTLPPGATGGTDSGHPDAVETWFVCKGEVAIDTGENVYELHEGDFLEIPPGVAHTLTNLGGTVAMAVWVGVGIA